MAPKLLVLDTETTGLVQPIGVVEVAWLELDDDLNIIPESKEVYLTNPEHPISEGASRTHGIIDEDITDDLPVLGDLKWPEGEVFLICHNVAYDRPLVEAYMNVIGSMCTYHLARRFLPDAPNHQLQTLAEYCELSTEVPHRAMGDIMTTSWLLKYMAEGSNMTLGQMMNHMEKPKVFKKIPFGKWKHLPLRQVPYGYMKWLDGEDLDPDIRATVNHYMRR